MTGRGGVDMEGKARGVGGIQILHAEIFRSSTTGPQENGNRFLSERSPMNNDLSLFSNVRLFKKVLPILSISALAFSGHFYLLKSRSPLLRNSKTRREIGREGVREGMYNALGRGVNSSLSTEKVLPSG